jgi:hypothetical protein
MPTTFEDDIVYFGKRACPKKAVFSYAFPNTRLCYEMVCFDNMAPKSGRRLSNLTKNKPVILNVFPRYKPTLISKYSLYQPGACVDDDGIIPRNTCMLMEGQGTRSSDFHRTYGADIHSFFHLAVSNRFIVSTLSTRILAAKS